MKTPKSNKINNEEFYDIEEIYLNTTDYLLNFKERNIEPKYGGLNRSIRNAFSLADFFDGDEFSIDEEELLIDED